MLLGSKSLCGACGPAGGGEDGIAGVLVGATTEPKVLGVASLASSRASSSLRSGFGEPGIGWMTFLPLIVTLSLPEPVGAITSSGSAGAVLLLRLSTALSSAASWLSVAAGALAKSAIWAPTVAFSSAAGVALSAASAAAPGSGVAAGSDAALVPS